MKLENKVIVVTGAGSGIGKELVLALIKKNAKVAAVDLRAESLDLLVKDLGEKANQISAYSLDISYQDAVLKLPEKIAKDLGEVDCVINNAGIIQPFERIEELDFEAINKVMNVNFYGTLYMVKAFLPYLLKRKEGYIANVSSMGGFLPVPGQSVYGASKAAVKLMTEGLYAELKDTNVGVSVVFPGATSTKISENSGVTIASASTSDSKSFKMLPASEAARLIILGIEREQLYIFTGQDSKMMNKIYRLSPKYATDLIAKKMESLLQK